MLHAKLEVFHGIGFYHEEACALLENWLLLVHHLESLIFTLVVAASALDVWTLLGGALTGIDAAVKFVLAAANLRVDIAPVILEVAERDHRLVQGVAVPEVAREALVVFVDVADARIVPPAEIAAIFKVVVVVVRVCLVVGVLLVGAPANTVLLAVVTAASTLPPVLAVYRRVAITISIAVIIIVVATNHRLLVVIVASAHEPSEGGAILVAGIALGEAAEETLQIELIVVVGRTETLLSEAASDAADSHSGKLLRYLLH